MKSKFTHALLGVAVMAGACSGVPATAMRVPRIELLREVRVTRADLRLSDLLPSGAKADLRSRAAEISLGAAPQPGTTRVLERGGILENISAREDVAREVEIPERVFVVRDVRPVTVEEVYAAIRNSLGGLGISVAASLRPEDVLLQTQVLVAPGDAGLEVLRSDFDAGLKRGRFLLWASRDPRVLPFFVTVRFASDPPAAGRRAAAKGNATLNKLEPAPVSVLAPARGADSEALVVPGEPATLVVHSESMRMTADVIPLERGAMGQRIRVRVADTGKVFSARVDGRGRLDMNF